MPNLPEHHESAKMVDIFPVDAPPPSTAPMPYASFTDTLAPADLRPMPPVQALREDAEVSAYLKHGRDGSAKTGKRFLKAFLCFIVCAIILFAATTAHGWTIFKGYSPPPVSATPKPLPYPIDPPFEFLGSVKAINDDILAGDKWGSAFERMKRLRKEMSETSASAPAEFRLWLDTEMLVAMASKEVPPGSESDSLPDALFADIIELSKDKEPPPLRAGFSYIRLLHANTGRDELTGEIDSRLLGVLELLRGDHATAMDRTPDILAIEADCNINALPKEYKENDRYLDYHWRRAAHAVRKLYQLAGPNDRIHIDMDRKRWEKVYSYFDFTLLTLSYSKFGRIAKVTLDGEEYTKEKVEEILGKLKRAG